MAIGSGLATQFGFKQESTYGTGVTVDRFSPIESESLTEEIDRLESSGIVTGRRMLISEQWAAGNRKISGGVKGELYQENMGALFKAALGANTTAGAGPYTHTCTPGDLSDDFLTLQIGKPDVAGTVQPFTFTGCMVTEWEVAAKAGELVTFAVDFVGQALATGTSLASASYGTGDAKPFTFAHASATVAGGAVPVKEISIKGVNGLDTERFFIGSDQISQPVENGLREYTGEATLEFSGLTQLNRFRNGTETALVLTIDNAADSKSVVFTLNARYDGTTPTVEGRGITMLKVPFKAVASSTDASAITVVVENADSAA